MKGTTPSMMGLKQVPILARADSFRHQILPKEFSDTLCHNPTEALSSTRFLFRNRELDGIYDAPQHMDLMCYFACRATNASRAAVASLAALKNMAISQARRHHYFSIQRLRVLKAPSA